MQKSLELKNLPIEPLACLHPDQKTGMRSIQKIRVVGSSLPCVKSVELTLLTDEWRVYAETDIPQEWVQKEDGTPVRIDQYWSQVLQLKNLLENQMFSVLAKTVKCALGLSHGNADNERSLSVNKKTLSKERSGLSIVTLNGLQAIEDGIRNVYGLSNIVVAKEMLSSVKGSYKAYMQHTDKEEGEEKKIKSNSSEAEAEEIRKKQEAEIKNLINSAKDFDARMSKDDQMLQSAYGFMEEGNKRMTEGLAEKNLDEIEAAQKIIQLAQEKQQKAQDELKIVHKEKRKLKLREKATRKLKVK